MIVSINQPAYLPWLGYFHRIAVSDLHIVLDHVQFEKNSFTNRNKIRTARDSCWLTVPVRTRSRFGKLAIDSLEIDTSLRWPEKHWQTLEQSYRKAPFFGSYAPALREVYSGEWTALTLLCRRLTGLMLDWLGITTPCCYSSEMNPQETKSALVLELCQKVGATRYLSGALGRDYLDIAEFRAKGIHVEFQDYIHPVYRQCQPGAFEPNMSALDLLFNHGPESLGILLSRGPVGAVEMP